MSRRRLLLDAFVAGTLLAAVGMGTASASPPAGGITAPGEGATVADATISGSFRHEGTGIESVTLTIRETGEGDPIPEPKVTAGCNSGPVTCSGDSASFSWSPDLPYNGVYRVEARATSGGSLLHDSSTATSTRTFSLAAPPEAPRKVTAEVDGDTRVTTVTWRSNTEPDLLHYAVTRTLDGAASTRFEVAASDAGTVSFVDAGTADRGGTYLYEVEAVRKGATGSSTVSSEVAASNPLAVSEPPPPPPTTTEEPAPGAAGPTPTSAPAGPPGTSPAAPQPAATSGIKGGTADLSGFGALRARATSPPPPRPTVLDPGFDETLPYADVPRTTAAPGPQADLPEDEGQAALPVSRSSGDPSDDRRALLVPMAAGLILFVGALQMRWVAGRAVEPLEAL